MGKKEYLRGWGQECKAKNSDHWRAIDWEATPRDQHWD